MFNVFDIPEHATLTVNQTADLGGVDFSYNSEVSLGVDFNLCIHQAKDLVETLSHMIAKHEALNHVERVVASFNSDNLIHAIPVATLVEWYVANQCPPNTPEDIKEALWTHRYSSQATATLPSDL